MGREKIGRQTKGVVFLLSLEKKFFISNSIKYCVDLFCGMFFYRRAVILSFPVKVIKIIIPFIVYLYIFLYEKAKNIRPSLSMSSNASQGKKRQVKAWQGTAREDKTIQNPMTTTM